MNVFAEQLDWQPLRRLSPRERQIAELIGIGTKASDIAAQLNLSPKTISTYRARILEKLQVGGTAEIAVLMWRARK